MDELRRLSAPNLAELHIVDHTFWDSTSIANFLMSSACALQKLVLRNVEVSAGSIGAVLRYVPTIHTLEVRDSRPNSLDDGLLVVIALLPGLTTMNFVGEYFFSTDTLLRMLQMRATTLRSVDLVLTRQVDAAHRAQFAALRPASIVLWRLRCLDENGQPSEVQ
ncbi:hypothetical protein DFH06DRAFT_1166937 [Mycena polygramma]|nr:hypothetical protein DFH06DRAFT_1166937 [Mycena polygramma]